MSIIAELSGHIQACQHFLSYFFILLILVVWQCHTCIYYILITSLYPLLSPSNPCHTPIPKKIVSRFMTFGLICEPFTSIRMWTICRNLMGIISGYITESNTLPSGPTSINYFSSEAWVSLNSSFIYAWLYSGSFLCMPSVGICNSCAYLIIIARLSKKMAFCRRPPYFMTLTFFFSKSTMFAES